MQQKTINLSSYGSGSKRWMRKKYISVLFCAPAQH